MKRHPIRRGTLALAALLFALAACDKAPAPAAPYVPTGIHHAPSANTVSMTPTRDGVIAPPDMVVSDDGASQVPLVEKTVKVGLLLPLTGRSSALGKTMQDAATVALFDKYARLSTAQQRIRVELLPKDSGDTAQQARTAMQEALDEGAELIIGPVFGPATEAAAPLATAKGVPVISFTNNNALAKPGVYAYGFLPQEQAQRVVGYAIKAGKGRIAALVPDSPSGEIVLKAARDTLASQGMALVAEAKYPAQGVGIEQALSALIPPGTPPNFDALLLPEGGPALATILRSLRTRGVTARDVQLIGTGFWDNPNLLRSVSLDGAWLASTPPQATALFEQRFLATYKYAPTRTASLAYDAVALAVTLATSNRPFDTPALTQSSGYSGPANGIFRLRGDGTVQRGLAVLQVQGTNLMVVDPAPAGFTTTAVTQ